MSTSPPSSGKAKPEDTEPVATSSSSQRLIFHETPATHTHRPLDTESVAASGDQHELPTYEDSAPQGANASSSSPLGPELPPSYKTASHQFHDRSSVRERSRPDSALRWGVGPRAGDRIGSESYEYPPDHPVHKIPLDEQRRLRDKGINPALKAEIDYAQNQHTTRTGRFLAKAGIGSGLGFNHGG